MKLKTREAIVGLVVYRFVRYMIRRSLSRKGGGIMATKRKVGLMATIVAAIGALFFWRKKKKGPEASV